MPPFRTIVSAIDFSMHSRVALRVALGLAGRGPSTVVVVHVIDLLLAEAAAAAYDAERLREDAESELRALVSEDRADFTTAPECVVRIGRAETEILACAREHRADLIVMGTHGLGGVRKMFFGSVTEKVLRGAEVPVLAVPVRRDQPPGKAGPFASVMAAVAFDEHADVVVSYGATLAAELGVSLELVHVLPPFHGSPRVAKALESTEPGRRRDALGRIEVMATRVSRTVSARTEILSGAPAEEIAAKASLRPDTLIVVGLGRHGLFRRPGSTAYRILSLSDVPVIAIPADSGTKDT